MVRLRGGAPLCLVYSLLLLFSAALCLAEKTDRVFVVVGAGECADCAKSALKPSQAFSGLEVKIDCKPSNGEFKTKGVGKLDVEGKFQVTLPSDIVSQDGKKLKEECYAQLHNPTAELPCAAHGGLKSTKVVFNSKKNAFELSGGKLKFSPEVCSSAFFWPYYKHPHLPKLKFPPLKSFFHHHFHYPPLPPKVYPPFPPKYTHPPIVLPPKEPKPPVFVKPPSVPKPEPKPPVVKPKPPVVKPTPKPPVYEPPPVPKELPPPVPIYKPKPKPPIFHKPLPPIPKVPIYKPAPHPPIYTKPLPPFPKVPIYKPIPKPPVSLPPFPKFPPYHKKKPCPPLPKLPPKKHYGSWPPLPPYAPIH